MYDLALPTDFDLTYPTARTADRVELEGVLPDLYEFTLDFWMKTSDTENYGTPISYATRVSEGFGDQDNILNLQDHNNFVLYVNRESAFTYTGANGQVVSRIYYSGELKKMVKRKYRIHNVFCIPLLKQNFFNN